jgi:ORF6N domain-containing protein
MAKKRQLSEPQLPEPAIFVIRGQRVILDADLARIYGVTTFRFNEAFKRNRQRFPEDFAFQLTADEMAAFRVQISMRAAQAKAAQGDTSNSSQFAMSSSQVIDSTEDASNWSQFATSSKRRGAAYRPWAFTEHGALMAANVLRSVRAVEMSVFVVRAFVRLRERIAANDAILKRLAEIDKTLLDHDQSLRVLWQRLQPLLAPPPDSPRKRIGFQGNS